MKIVAPLLIFAGSFAASVIVGAQSPAPAPSPIVTVKHSELWRNPECETGPCALKSIRLTTYQDIDDTSASMRVATRFKTSDKTQLKDYAFVQYIRGCSYSVDAKGNRQMGTRTNIGMSGVPFQHKTWQLDTGVTTDPVYQSEQGGGDDPLRGIHLPRTGSYYTSNPLTNPTPVSWGGIETNIKTPQLYIFDSPTGSSMEVDGSRAISSLEFRTCLYHVADLPEKVSDANHVFPGAVHCLEWKSNFAYNATAKRFGPVTAIDSFCDVDPAN